MKLTTPLALAALSAVAALLALSTHRTAVAGEKPDMRTYENRLTPLKNPEPLLADHPEWVAPVREAARFEAPPILDDSDADLEVRAWRFSYNARGIIEMTNRIRASETAVVVVHPWGIDDGQGWRTPEPAGVSDFCTPIKNHLSGKHTRGIIDPFLKRLRGKVRLVLYSLPGSEDPIRKKLYRSVRATPSESERAQGKQELALKLNSFPYRGEPLPKTLSLGRQNPVADYFRKFPGLDSSARYEGEGFWSLPIPVTRDLTVYPDDVVIFDAEGYPLMREFLRREGVRNVLLTGYATDMCYCKTTAGYQNLSPDFNVFLVGDATLATFPSNSTPAAATNASISYAALDHLITQVSHVRPLSR
jgi:hypothetical protein